jgi:hypothetical protein
LIGIIRYTPDGGLTREFGLVTIRLVHPARDEGAVLSDPMVTKSGIMPKSPLKGQKINNKIA